MFFFFFFFFFSHQQFENLVFGLKCSSFSLKLNDENRFTIRAVYNEIHVFERFLFGAQLIGERSEANRPFSHCFCACVYRSRDALFLDNRRDFT